MRAEVTLYKHDFICCIDGDEPRQELYATRYCTDRRLSNCVVNNWEFNEIVRRSEVVVAVGSSKHRKALAQDTILRRLTRNLFPESVVLPPEVAAAELRRRGDIRIAECPHWEEEFTLTNFLAKVAFDNNLFQFNTGGEYCDESEYELTAADLAVVNATAVKKISYIRIFTRKPVGHSGTRWGYIRSDHFSHSYYVNDDGSISIGNGCYLRRPMIYPIL